MNAEIYKFSIGKFECIAIRDWLVHYNNPATLLFPKVPKDRLKQVSSGKHLIHCFHFEFPGLGYIIERKGMIRWQPLSLDGSGY